MTLPFQVEAPASRRTELVYRRALDETEVGKTGCTSIKFAFRNTAADCAGCSFVKPGVNEAIVRCSVIRLCCLAVCSVDARRAACVLICQRTHRHDRSIVA
jgi:hypothetical protein